MLGASGEWEAGSFSWNRPKQSAQTQLMRRHHGGGEEGEDGATFHLLGVVFLNPRSAH